jgi:molybdopterin synthase catalytic subunit
MIPGGSVSYPFFMRVRVLYFGMLRELAGHAEESVEVNGGGKLADLYAQLQQRVPQLAALSRSIALSINSEYAEPGTTLRDGDEVALLPPVSGGSQSAPITMSRCRIVRDPIDAASVAEELKHPEDGAVVLFDGIVRNNSRGRRTLYLEYSAYESMALKEMEKLTEQALSTYKVRDIRVVHRLGRLEIGETSVLIGVASAHRAAAFDAARWIIDTLKKTVPIWKKEFFEDGAVWADGEPFPPEVSLLADSASK